MNRPLLLDLFCGAGGAAMGYHRAGFEVVGVDIRPQPRYPFPFIEHDALDLLDSWLRDETNYGYMLDDFAAVHASPPCQDYSRAMRHLAGTYPRLIDPVRERLAVSGLPWVIENVQGAPLPVQSTLDGAHGVELCGTMLGLAVQRHRLFECSFPVGPPRGCDHSQPTVNVYKRESRKRFRAAHGYDPRRGGHWQKIIGVPWMSNDEASEAIPPAYTEYIGQQLLEHLADSHAA